MRIASSVQSTGLERKILRSGSKNIAKTVPIQAPIYPECGTFPLTFQALNLAKEIENNRNGTIDFLLSTNRQKLHTSSNIPSKFNQSFLDYPPF